MKSKIAIKTRKAFNDWLDVGNLFAKSMCERGEILRQFNALSGADRVKIKKRFDDCDAIIEVLKTRHNKLGFVGLKYNKKANTYYECKKINNLQEENEKANVIVPKPELIPLGTEDLPFDDNEDIFSL